MNIVYYDIIKIAVAFLLGAVLGVEREYHNKPAGFRTLIMITVGATLFTILSGRITANPDRIAANIITGIGFIGAGVIFKEGIKVNGVTTAATIWISAAVGMAVGYGQFILAIGVTLLMLGTLIILIKLESFFDGLYQAKFYKITFLIGQYNFEMLQHTFSSLKIKFKKDKELKSENTITVFYRLSATKKEFDVLNGFLIENADITAFEV
jgi:putative Mg2+ transporter-C (MgtC) family protein